ncbi:unnamed protein product [Adineta steineri]|uniref:Uncharacterized protein n=1 Tax=Adineta steineri TaxID=433720 RepID=A0A815LSJ9_9BILA|nr:unnamed protein product [Adineta steineri]CAF1617118.1 unnamed protein product [Adineta steineri]
MAFLLDLLGLGHSKNAYDQVYQQQNNYGGDYQNYGDNMQQPHHKASWTHELIGGAAGFAAMKAYEDHVRSTGEKVSHPLMKEMLAGFAAAEVDRLFETKGLDFLDREKAKRRAIDQAHHIANEQYGPGGTFNYEQNQYGSAQNYYQQPGGPGYNPQQGGPGYNPQQGGPEYYPQQGGPNYYPQQGGSGYYPQQGGPNYYPQPGGPGYNPQQGGSNYYPQQGGPSYNPQQCGQGFY